jgi:hypothetical protein
MSCDGDHLELSYNVNLHMSAIVTILNFSFFSFVLHISILYDVVMCVHVFLFILKLTEPFWCPFELCSSLCVCRCLLCDGDHLELSYNVNLHMSAIVTILNFSSTQVVKYNKQKFAEHAQHPWNIPVKFVFQIVQRFLVTIADICRLTL